MMNANDNHVIENIPAYALGALDEPEKEAVERHLESCDICQEELRQYQLVTDELGFGARVEAPSPELKNKVMAQVRSKTPEKKESGSWWERWLPSGRIARTVWNTAGAALILALAFSNLSLWRQVRQQQIVLESFQTIPLTGTEAQPDATGVILVSLDGKSGTLVADSLKPLSPEQQYQLWLILDEERVSGGVFSVSEEGYATLEISAPLGMTAYDSIGITVEPAGGSDRPTGDKVLGGEF